MLELQPLLMIGRKSQDQIIFNQRIQMVFKDSTVTMYYIKKLINLNQPRSILKPGESKTFIFSFRSESKPGMFFEEWELLSDPSLLAPLPLINLSGIAIQRDNNVERRDEFLKRRE